MLTYEYFTANAQYASAFEAQYPNLKPGTKAHVYAYTEYLKGVVTRVRVDKDPLLLPEAKKDPCQLPAGELLSKDNEEPMDDIDVTWDT